MDGFIIMNTNDWRCNTMQNKPTRVAIGMAISEES